MVDAAADYAVFRWRGKLGDLMDSVLALFKLVAAAASAASASAAAPATCLQLVFQLNFMAL